jgi:hypothetical protein
LQNPRTLSCPDVASLSAARYRHCPTGDDPGTPGVDETNCTKVVARGGHGIGEVGNKCHVDCSNRGVCDYITGECACFEGFYGLNCGKMSVFAKQQSSSAAKKTTN